MAVLPDETERRRCLRGPPRRARAFGIHCNMDATRAPAFASGAAPDAPKANENALATAQIGQNKFSAPGPTATRQQWS